MQKFTDDQIAGMKGPVAAVAHHAEITVERVQEIRFANTPAQLKKAKRPEAVAKLRALAEEYGVRPSTLIRWDRDA